MLITSDTTLRQFIPNALVTVDGEKSLFDKIASFLETSEEWLIQTFVPEPALQKIVAQERQPFLRLLMKTVANDAFLHAVPSLDLVLTPNGFGIVSNQNIAPASKERVDRLLASLESERDQAIDLLLPRLPLLTDWQQSAQGQYFAATLFPNLSLCRRLAIRQHLWAEYQALHDRLIKIENTLAETYFSQEQMSVFRDKALHLLTNCHPLEVQVIRSLQSLELEILTADHINSSPSGDKRGAPCFVQSFFDLVNTIRENESVFPEWHASATAELYTPSVFRNKKNSGGYWF
ncbi:MAG: hypothetical protein IKX36_11075 [Prevotella sp.]|nr:hypothetical protein [Prevotella sp.]